MRRFFFFIFLFVITACKQVPVEKTSDNKAIDFTTLGLNNSKITLVNQAQKNALQWQVFQDFLTGLENYDHTITATNVLIDKVNTMLLDPQESFNNQAVMSRMKVLKTRLSIYKSYLGYTTKTPEQIKKKYNDITTALDELIDQMNAQVNLLQPDNKKFLENLKADADLGTSPDSL
jgi:hypothetical protein